MGRNLESTEGKSMIQDLVSGISSWFVTNGTRWPTIIVKEIFSYFLPERDPSSEILHFQFAGENKWPKDLLGSGRSDTRILSWPWEATVNIWVKTRSLNLTNIIQSKLTTDFGKKNKTKQKELRKGNGEKKGKITQKYIKLILLSRPKIGKS